MKFFFCLLLATLPLLAEPFKIIQDKTTLPIETPSLKNQKTLKIELQNGLQAILISDPEVEKSAVAISVMAGSWQDPDDFPGLAHFLEHMLFLGTSEYPDESDFTRFLSEHGGETNAFTTVDFTSYMFSVNTSGFPEALKRFASFFKTPLFNPSGVNRELSAIDSEFAQGFNQESRRQYQVLKDIANKNHPFHRFQTGNSTSLAKATTDDLRKWFDEHYSANIMRLYVLSPLPLNQIRDLVVEDFSGIVNKNKSIYANKDPLFPSSMVGHFLYIASKKNIQTLSFVWELPLSDEKELETKPDDLLCHVLAHEGHGSLLSELKKEGLASTLYCGTTQLGAKPSLFQIEIGLTEKGFHSIDTVIENVFKTIKKLIQNPFPKSVFDDEAATLKQKYQFAERHDPFEWAMNHALWLVQEPMPTYPELSQTIHRFDPEGVNALVRSLTPEKALFILTAPEEDLKTKSSDPFLEEPWMQVSYSIHSLPKDTLDAWKNSEPHPHVNYPGVNAFIAHSLSINPPLYERSSYPNLPLPELLIENEATRIYYAPDPFYQIPRSFIKLQIGSPEIKEGRAQNIVLADLYIKNLEDAMGELIYEAKMADLTFTITRNEGTLELTFEGFTESLESFIPQMIEKLKSGGITQEKFEIFKSALQKDYENFSKEMPIKQAFEQFKDSIYVDYTSYAQKTLAIRNITLENFKKFEENIFKKTFLKGLVTGSLSKEKAFYLLSNFEKTLHPKPNFYSPLTTPEIRNFPKDAGPFLLTRATQAKGDALLLILEVPGFSPSLRNSQELLSLVMGPVFFKDLRTLQQTGYITTSDTTTLQKHLYTYFAVQSTTHTTEELLWRFEQFIETYDRGLTHEEIPEAGFGILKNTLLLQLKEPPASLQVYGELLFKLAFEIQNLNWMNERVQELSKLPYDEFVDFVHRFLGRTNKQRFAIMMQGFHEKEGKFHYIPIKNTFPK